jgi:hypothetical protein
VLLHPVSELKLCDLELREPKGKITTFPDSPDFITTTLKISGESTKFQISGKSWDLGNILFLSYFGFTCRRPIG